MAVTLVQENGLAALDGQFQLPAKSPFLIVV